MMNTCGDAERGGASWQVVFNCKWFAGKYFSGVDIAGAAAYAAAQQVAASCVASGGTDGTLGSGGGAVTDLLFGDGAQVQVTANVLSTPTSIAIDVLSTDPVVPMPTGFRKAASYYVAVTLTPKPSSVLPPPGVRVVLPLVNRLAAGTVLTLYRIDMTSGDLIPATSVDGNPILGIVNADEYTATFSGIGGFSTLVGLLSRPPVAGDLDGDLRVDCADVSIVQQALGKRTGQAGWDPRADTNLDGVVDIRDLSFVSQKLPAGTRCQ
jgi:hypothetical protein